MECADSKVSIDSISRNKVSAVRTEKVVKWCIVYTKRFEIATASKGFNKIFIAPDIFILSH